MVIKKWEAAGLKADPDEAGGGWADHFLEAGHGADQVGMTAVHSGGPDLRRESGAGVEDDVHAGVGQDLIGKVVGVVAGNRPVSVYKWRKAGMGRYLAIDDSVRHAAKIRNPPDGGFLRIGKFRISGGKVTRGIWKGPIP